MKTPKLPDVTFFRVKEAKSKISVICQKIEEAFKKKKRLLIAVPNDEVAQYIDLLLWRLPEESFIPHVISSQTSKEWITITVQPTQNVNQASQLFNLCPDVNPIYEQFERVYELFDETHPQKTALSQERFSKYQSFGCALNLV